MPTNYRVHIFIRGAVSRPPYNGYVDVVAENETEAGPKAIRELMKTTFKDVWFNSFHIERIVQRS